MVSGGNDTKGIWIKDWHTPLPAEIFHSRKTMRKSSPHRANCFFAWFSNFKVCFGGTYWNALHFSEAPQNRTESENCGGIGTVSLKITRKKKIGLGRSREGLWRSFTQGSGTRSTNLLWPSLLAHPKLQKVNESGPRCLYSSSTHMIRNTCRAALGKITHFIVMLFFDLLSTFFFFCIKTLG